MPPLGREGGGWRGGGGGEEGGLSRVKRVLALPGRLLTAVGGGEREKEEERERKERKEGRREAINVQLCRVIYN